jgi:hypothetical protein
LVGSNLKGARLVKANLQSADLTMANLQEANLLGADMHEAWGLTNQQLIKAAALYGAIMPDSNRYDGRFKLKNDIAPATQSWPSINLDDDKDDKAEHGQPCRNLLRCQSVRKSFPEASRPRHSIASRDVVVCMILRTAAQIVAKRLNAILRCPKAPRP